MMWVTQFFYFLCCKFIVLGHDALILHITLCEIGGVVSGLSLLTHMILVSPGSRPSPLLYSSSFDKSRGLTTTPSASPLHSFSFFWFPCRWAVLVVHQL